MSNGGSRLTRGEETFGASDFSILQQQTTASFTAITIRRARSVYWRSCPRTDSTMNLMTRSASASLPIGTPSSPSSAEGAVVIKRDFHPSRPVPLGDAVTLSSLMAEYEAHPQRAALLAEARAELAGSLYAAQE